MVLVCKKLVNIGMSERSRIDTQPRRDVNLLEYCMLNNLPCLSCLFKEISSTREALFLKIKAF